MATQLVKCPTCKNTITISGEPNEKILLACPQCKQKGMFIMPDQNRATTIGLNSATIDVKGLTKSYNHFTAVNNVSFTVNKGEIFGFLGPNGAGKTTTIKALLDLVHANSGTIKINGIPMIRPIFLNRESFPSEIFPFGESSGTRANQMPIMRNFTA